MEDTDPYLTPGNLWRIPYELPKGKVALFLLVVVLNVTHVVYVRGHDLGVDHAFFIHSGCCTPATCAACDKRLRNKAKAERWCFSPPWRWSLDEWRETLWPSK